MKSIKNYKLAILLFLLLFTNTILSQGSEVKDKPKEKSNRGFVIWLSEQDLILPITSIEWGTPDRWSITSRYIHELGKERSNKTWLNNLTITLSPGTAGGRLGIGYQSIFDPKSIPDLTLLSEARIVLLRTWGNPFSTVAGSTFIGAEIRNSLGGMINFGIGYYSQISGSNNGRKKFYGLHIGLGI